MEKVERKKIKLFRLRSTFSFRLIFWSIFGLFIINLWLKLTIYLVFYCIIVALIMLINSIWKVLSRQQIQSHWIIEKKVGVGEFNAFNTFPKTPCFSDFFLICKQIFRQCLFHPSLSYPKIAFSLWHATFIDCGQRSFQQKLIQVLRKRSLQPKTLIRRHKTCFPTNKHKDLSTKSHQQCKYFIRKFFKYQTFKRKKNRKKGKVHEKNL